MRARGWEDLARDPQSAAYAQIAAQTGALPYKELAQQIAERGDQLGLVWRLVAGTVAQPTPDGLMTVSLDGDSVAIEAVSMIGRLPVGGRVFVILSPPAGVHIVGFLGPSVPSEWTDYDLEFTSVAGSPDLGNAVVSARFIQPSSKVVHVAVRVLWGTTSDFGSGGWGFSLPVAAAVHSQKVGDAYCRRTSAGGSGHYPAICVADVNTPTKVNLFNVTAQVGPTYPFTWVPTDYLDFSLTYEPA